VAVKNILFSFLLVLLSPFGGGLVFGENDSLTTSSSDTFESAVQANSEFIDSLYSDSLMSLFQMADSLVLDSSIIRSNVQELDSFKKHDPSYRTKRTHAWVLIMALFILILIGSLRSLDSNRYYYALRTPFRSLKSEAAFFELIPGIDIFQIVFIVIYALILSFAIHIFQPFDLKLTFDADWRNYIVLVLIVISVYTLKYAIYYLIFQVLLTDKLPRMMVVSMSNLGFLFAIISFPVLMIVYYSLNDVLRSYLGVGFAILLGLFLAYRFFRLLFLAWPSFTFNRVYIFIYLCTLEILPLLLVAKWVGILG